MTLIYTFSVDPVLWKMIDIIRRSIKWKVVVHKLQSILMSPTTAKRVAQCYAEVMRDERTSSMMGPAALTLANAIHTQSTLHKKIMPAVLKGGRPSDPSPNLPFSTCYSSFPNWVDVDTLTGSPPIYPAFQCIWIEPREVSMAHCIGSGAFGDVYTGIYCGVDVVVKTYSEKGMTPFMQIIYEAVTWTHMMLLDIAPPIIGLCENEEPELPSIVGRFYLNAQTLGTILCAINNLSLPEIIKLTVDAADLILKMHNTQFLHNDIKEDNIIVYPDPECKTKYIMRLIDFGLTTYRRGYYFCSADEGKGKNALADHVYLAPELGYGNPTTTKTDVFSFGALVDLVCECAENQAVSTWLQPVAEKCCQVNPDDRPSIDQVAMVLRKKWTMMQQTAHRLAPL